MSKLFKTNKPSYQYLKRKWTQRQRISQNKLWDNHSNSLKSLAVGSLSSLMLLSNPLSHQLPAPHLTFSREDALRNYDENVLLAKILSEKTPKSIRPLNNEEEDALSRLLSEKFRFKVTPEIDGIRLNRYFGIIGGEQHLYRYPGDNLYAHLSNLSDYIKYGKAGIAPKLGAWGYFSSSKQEFGEKDLQRERYYLAIQTFLAPGYAENFQKFRDFFKMRKMLVINPRTGQAVVAVVADVGPSEWTGKHLGGSPEVMDVLGLGGGPRKGSVVYFFVDDPKDEVPLGPVSVKKEAKI